MLFPVIYFVGCNFDHLPNILSLLSDQNIPDKVCFFTVLRGFLFFFLGGEQDSPLGEKNPQSNHFFQQGVQRRWISLGQEYRIAKGT